MTAAAFDPIQYCQLGKENFIFVFAFKNIEFCNL